MEEFFAALLFGIIIFGFFELLNLYSYGWKEYKKMWKWRR